MAQIRSQPLPNPQTLQRQLLIQSKIEATSNSMLVWGRASPCCVEHLRILPKDQNEALIEKVQEGRDGIMQAGKGLACVFGLGASGGSLFLLML